MEVPTEGRRHLVFANRILAREGVVDACGHLSVRDRTWEYCSRRAGCEHL